MMTEEKSEVRVLVAEDNEDHLFFITRALRQFDGSRFAVDSVRDGADALDYLQRRGTWSEQPRPHLIILDLRMPRVSGLEVLARLQEDEDLRGIPVAVLSSSDRKEDVDEAYRRGGNTYMVKRASFEGINEELRAVGEFWTEHAVLPDPPP